MGTPFCDTLDRLHTRTKREVRKRFWLSWACQQRAAHPSLQSLWRNFFTLDFRTKRNGILNTLTFWKEDHRYWENIWRWAPLKHFHSRFLVSYSGNGAHSILNVTFLTTRGKGLYLSLSSTSVNKDATSFMRSFILSYPAPRGRIRKNVQN